MNTCWKVHLSLELNSESFPVLLRLSTFFWKVSLKLYPRGKHSIPIILLPKPIVSSGYHTESLAHSIDQCPAFEELLLCPPLQNHNLPLYILTLREYQTRNRYGLTYALYLLWQLWKAQNKAIFQQQDSRLIDVIRESRQHTSLYYQCFPIHNQYQLFQIFMPIKWRPSFYAPSKLNIDRAAWHNPGRAGIRGIFRNDQGTCLIAYAKPIGIRNNNLTAELSAIREVLILSWQSQFWSLHIETDSLVAWHLLTRSQDMHTPQQRLVDDCRELIRRLDSEMEQQIHSQRQQHQQLLWT